VTDNPARTSDLEKLGYSGDSTVAQGWLDVVWRRLCRDVPSLVTRLNANEVATQDVIDVLATATMRVLRNPEGHAQETTSIDDYSESWTRADATSDVYFTAAELRGLLPPDPYADSFAGSIQYAGSPPHPMHHRW
jgi:hypothetical protein